MTALRARQQRWAAAAAVLTAVTAAAAVILPVEFVTSEPGPVFDVLGEHDGEPVIDIEGAQTYPTTGRLDLVTVSQYGGTTSLWMGSALAAWLLPTRTVEPADVRYPPGSQPEQEKQIDAAVFEASTSSALAAAANYLGHPVQVVALVSEVDPGSPADGHLKSGDTITAVGDQPTSTSADVVAAVSALPAESPVPVSYVRDGAPATTTIPSGTRPDGSPGAYLGILLVDSYTSDFTADVSLQGIGGPSAGLVFSLAMIDQLTAQDLLEGGHIAGTGTIDAAGTVGPIGGIQYKIVSVAKEGASLFLVPRGNCGDLEGRIPDDLKVVPVDTLQGAIDSITAARAGDGDLPTCS